MAKKKRTKISIGSIEKVREVAKKLGKSESFVWNAMAGRTESADAEACIEFIKKNYQYRTITTTY